MSDTKHTPGPWRTERFAQAESEQSVSTELHANSGYIGTFTLELDPDTPEDVAEFLANARLIAAAPELLEALELSEQALSGVPMAQYDLSFVLSQVRAAIRK